MIKLFLIWAILVAMTIHGLVLSFSASVVVGIVAIFLQPLPLIFSLVYLVSGVNLAAKIASELGLG